MASFYDVIMTSCLPKIATKRLQRYPKYFFFEYNFITKLCFEACLLPGSICKLNSQRTINSILSFTVHCYSKIYFTMH